jgi:hypothetical protein
MTMNNIAPLSPAQATALAALPSEPPGLTLAEWAEAAGASQHQLRRWLPRMQENATAAKLIIGCGPVARRWRYRLCTPDDSFGLRTYVRMLRYLRTSLRTLGSFYVTGVRALEQEGDREQAAEVHEELSLITHRWLMVSEKLAEAELALADALEREALLREVVP